MLCKYFDSGWCYAPSEILTSATPDKRCLNPNACLYLQSQMTTQKDDLVFEIQELQTEIDEHVRKINQLKSVIQVKEQQLKEIPITLQRIIEECMLARNREIQLDLVENILDRVEVEFFSKLQQEAGDTETYYKNKGWNNCLKELKTRLRE